MTLYEANLIFLDDIYNKSGTRNTRLITALKLGLANNKDAFKHIVAMEYLTILSEFQGDYNSIYNERTLYNVYKFLEKYFDVELQYGWTYIKDKMSEWILRYGTWDDSLFWVDSEFWND